MPSTVRPDAEAMRRHVDHVFGGELAGCHDGMVELAWRDARSRRLQNAQSFRINQLDQLVERAVTINLEVGQNVYIGQAIRRPETSAAGRTSDADFFALTCFYIDIDDDVVETAKRICQERGCPPTAMVVTGRAPHLRAQMLWRLEALQRDAELCRSQNRALAAGLGGDPSVVNPGRVMRLGGSVAWPVKSGRVLEPTEFLSFDDGRPPFYNVSQIAAAFPVDMIRAAQLPVAAAGVPTRRGSGHMGVSVAHCLERARASDCWHDNVLQLVGHWIARGWSDIEILGFAESLTLPGWTADETRRQVAAMISGGRTKWAVPDPVHAIDGLVRRQPLTPGWLDDLDVVAIPRRRYLLGKTLVRGHVTVRVSPPGAGKSILAVEEGVAVATGRAITGETVHEQTKVWVYNAEDDGDELRRRLAAVLAHWRIPFDAVRGHLALDSGVDRPLLVATTDRLGNVVRQPDVDAVIEQIRASGIGLLVVDPFIETHEVDENANGQIRLAAAMFREIARRSSCAVLLAHHTAKPPQGSSEGHAGNLNTVRGGGAIAGVARVVQTLFGMSAKDAKRAGVADEQRHLHVRLDDAKANLSLIDGKPRWFRRVSVTIANGEEVGVLVLEDLEAQADAPDADDPALANEIVEAVARAWRSGVPLSDSPRATTRYAPAMIAQACGRPIGTIEPVLHRLIAAGVLRRETFDAGRHMAGLQIVPFGQRLLREASESTGEDDE